MNQRIKIRLSLAVLLSLVFAVSVCSQKDAPAVIRDSATRPEKSIKVTYIANEGVLIESAQKRVLIDGLHRIYKDAYAYPPDELRSLLENARSPYDKIDLLLVSHIHGDHFHPKSVGLHLSNNPKTKLAASGQVISEIIKEFGEFDSINPQIQTVTHRWKTSSEFDFDGINVKFLGLRHANERFKRIENFGHLIQIGGKTILHIGDADMTGENFSTFGLRNENIDLAFIPFWFLMSEEGRLLVKNQIGPKHIVAVHVSPDGAKKVKEDLQKHNPEITVFTNILESASF